MTAIRVLIVLDGNRFTFGPTSTTAEGVFSIQYFIKKSLLASTNPSFLVTTAHRRTDPNGGKPDHQNFTFTSIDLSQFDVIWLFGDEGYNDRIPSGSEITDDEKIAIANFMQAGGGVFAVGDHDGIGSYMCGDILRVRTMRKWFEAEHPTAGFPSNWSTGGILGGETRLLPRMDTIRPDLADGQYYFYDQSDRTPQPLTVIGIHPILRGPNGTILQFPDHMHEGEAIGLDPSSPFLTAPPITYHGATLGTQSFTEFPTLYGYQERPEVIATVTEIPNHTTVGPGGNYTSVATDNPPKTAGALSVYWGDNAEVGRVVTGSTFHHYLDINLLGDPTTASQQTGVGPTGSNFGLAPDVLAGMKAFYVNAVTWLAERQLRLSITPTVVVGGLQNAIGTVTLVGPMPSDGLQVHLFSNKPQLAMVPSGVTIGPASKSASFTITTTNPPVSDSVFISAYSDDASSANTYLGVVPQPLPPPPPPPPGTLDGLTFDADFLGFGETTVGTVTLAPPAQPQAVTVALSCDKPKFAKVPPSVTVPAGQTAASFTVNTLQPRPLPRVATVVVSASAGGVTLNAELTLSRQ